MSDFRRRSTNNLYYSDDSDENDVVSHRNECKYKKLYIAKENMMECPRRNMKCLEKNDVKDGENNNKNNQKREDGLWHDIYHELKKENKLGEILNKIQSIGVNKRNDKLIYDVAGLIELVSRKKVVYSPNRRNSFNLY